MEPTNEKIQNFARFANCCMYIRKGMFVTIVSKFEIDRTHAKHISKLFWASLDDFSEIFFTLHLPHDIGTFQSQIGLSIPQMKKSRILLDFQIVACTYEKECL